MSRNCCRFWLIAVQSTCTRSIKIVYQHVRIRQKEQNKLQKLELRMAEPFLIISLLRCVAVDAQSGRKSTPRDERDLWWEIFHFAEQLFVAQLSVEGLLAEPMVARLENGGTSVRMEWFQGISFWFKTLSVELTHAARSIILLISLSYISLQPTLWKTIITSGGNILFLLG